MLLTVGVLALALAGSPAVTPWFSDGTLGAGIPPLRHGEGVNAVDLTGDGLSDLYLPCVRERGRLLKNLGQGRFEEDPEAAGLVQKGGVGAAVGDLDGDGRPDIYVARGADPYVAPHLVLLQQRDGTFRDGAAAAGVGKQTSGLSVTLADFNGDGARDAFLPGWGRDLLLLNDGRGHLAEASQAGGINRPGRGWTSLASDLDGDGHLDLFVTRGSYAEPRDNRLYRNRGDGSFVDVTEAAGLAQSPWSLGAVTADFDGDGDFDLYVAGYSGPGRLYRNDGGTFRDVSAGSGLAAAKCVGAAAGFVDGDLLPDLVVAGFAGPVRIYRNLGNLRFVEVGEAAGLQPFARNEGLVLADLDEDGDLDLYVANVEGNNRLYWNRLDDPHFVKIVFAPGGPVREGTVARLRRDGVLLATLELAGAVGLGQGPEQMLFRVPDGGPFALSLTFPGGRTLELTEVRPGILRLP